MTASERRRFEALFASYSPDVVAYCGNQEVHGHLFAPGQTPAPVAPANARSPRERLRARSEAARNSS